jgi:hypothetical protein
MEEKSSSDLANMVFERFDGPLPCPNRPPVSELFLMALFCLTLWFILFLFSLRRKGSGPKT